MLFRIDLYHPNDELAIFVHNDVKIDSVDVHEFTFDVFLGRVWILLRVDIEINKKDTEETSAYYDKWTRSWRIKRSTMRAFETWAMEKTPIQSSDILGNVKLSNEDHHDVNVWRSTVFQNPCTRRQYKWHDELSRIIQSLRNPDEFMFMP